MESLLFGTATAFGLATAAGLNTTVPLLIVGLLARYQMLGLAPPYDALATDTTLTALALLAAFEFIGDKVPGADSIVHALQWPMAGASGAVLFSSQTSAVSWISPELALVAGLLTAGTMHGARMTARPVVTVSTVGMGNPIVSLLEDVMSVFMAGLAILLPIIALVVALVLAGLAFVVCLFALPRVIRLFRRRPPRPSNIPQG